MALSDLRLCLEEAAGGHVDLTADIAPIRGLIDQGCDLEADILPIVTREVPELPRPLKKWGRPVACPGDPCRPRPAACGPSS
jgi:hypothetical protein